MCATCGSEGGGGCVSHVEVCVRCNKVLVILSQYNVPNCLISDIIQMYSDTSACFSTELGPTEWF